MRGRHSVTRFTCCPRRSHLLSKQEWLSRSSTNSSRATHTGSCQWQNRELACTRRARLAHAPLPHSLWARLLTPRPPPAATAAPPYRQPTTNHRLPLIQQTWLMMLVRKFPNLGGHRAHWHATGGGARVRTRIFVACAGLQYPSSLGTGYQNAAFLRRLCLAQAVQSSLPCFRSLAP